MKRRCSTLKLILWILGLALAWAVVVQILFHVVDDLHNDVAASRRAAAVIRYSGASAEDLTADAEAPAYEVYREGDGPAPAWYDPSEPMAAEWSAAEDYILDVPLDAEFQRYLHDLCEDYGVPYTLAVAVIEAESSYMPTVISTSHDYGLMQINAVCHEWLRGELGIVDFLDPYENVRAGVYILAGYYAQYGYPSGTLVAYNQGQYAAERLFEQGIYTSAYSDRVIGIRDRLEQNGR